MKKLDIMFVSIAVLGLGISYGIIIKSFILK